MVRFAADRLGAIDVHPGNQYHNRFFRDLAVRSGLTCGPRHATYGYAFTQLSSTGREAVADLRPDREVFRWSVDPSALPAVPWRLICGLRPRPSHPNPLRIIHAAGRCATRHLP